MPGKRARKSGPGGNHSSSPPFGMLDVNKRFISGYVSRLHSHNWLSSCAMLRNERFWSENDWLHRHDVTKKQRPAHRFAASCDVPSRQWECAFGQPYLPTCSGFRVRAPFLHSRGAWFESHAGLDIPNFVFNFVHQRCLIFDPLSFCMFWYK